MVKRVIATAKKHFFEFLPAKIRQVIFTIHIKKRTGIMTEVRSLLPRRHSELFFENLGKIVPVVESAGKGNFRDGTVGVFQQCRRVVNAAFGQVFRKGFSRVFSECVADIGRTVRKMRGKQRE